MEKRLPIPADHLEAVIQVICQEPILEGNIWKQLPFFTALRETIWMILHPYSNTRRSARLFRNVIIRELRKAQLAAVQDVINSV